MEAPTSGVAWPAIIGGAFAAAALSLILIALGSGFGLASVSPWSGSGDSLTTFTVTTAVWLIIMQWSLAARTGVSQADAAKRVDEVIAQEKAAALKVRQAADAARKAGSYLSIFTGLSMLIGAFIACAAAALGGQQRDEQGHPDVPFRRAAVLDASRAGRFLSRVNRMRLFRCGRGHELCGACFSASFQIVARLYIAYAT